MGPGLKIHPAIVVLLLPFVMVMWAASGAPLYAVAICSSIVVAVTFPKLAKRTAKGAGKLGLSLAKLSGKGAVAAYKAHQARRTSSRTKLVP